MAAFTVLQACIGANAFLHPAGMIQKSRLAPSISLERRGGMHCPAARIWMMGKDTMSPSADPTLKERIATFYDQSSPLWEDIWGEHMHMGAPSPPVFPA